MAVNPEAEAFRWRPSGLCSSSSFLPYSAFFLPWTPGGDLWRDSFDLTPRGDSFDLFSTRIVAVFQRAISLLELSIVLTQPEEQFSATVAENYNTNVLSSPPYKEVMNTQGCVLGVHRKSPLNDLILLDSQEVSSVKLCDKVTFLTQCHSSKKDYEQHKGMVWFEFFLSPGALPWTSPIASTTEIEPDALNEEILKEAPQQHHNCSESLKNAGPFPFVL
ncbi:hypothetical protein P7K49_001603 [Saguinus oedipus]|uniref:Uncharacterized protein n=1 Tax=Saguinus oedipus TaxID=9490 RepID=A0ABQ9WIU6_SAGOE|nr:hypothetical protein P7K49_001603 [Saguinus oedipus]